jgi:hypothetical protein
VNHYRPRHAKPAERFRETAAFKAISLAAAAPVAVGVVATGGAVATHYLSGHPVAPGAYYGVTTYDHADSNHVETGGEWVRIESSPTIGTASTGGITVVPRI